MKKHTRSILQEINTLGVNRNNDLLIETTANNIINSSINLLETIYETYGEEVAYELERKFLNSIRTSDPNKFKRGITRVMENKKKGEANESGKGSTDTLGT
jgi:hypothetical protein